MSLFTAALFGGCGVSSILSNADPDVIYEAAFKFYDEGRFSKASRCFENIASYYIGSDREDSIMFFNAKCKYKDEDYYSAIGYLESYRQRYYRSPFLEDAEGMLTMSYYYSAPRPERDQGSTKMAISSIDEFFSRHPKSDKTEVFVEIRAELVQRLHDKSFNNAYTYYKIGNFKSAIVALRNALKEYPESTNREKIMYYLILSSYELAVNSIEELEMDRHMAVIDSYYTFVAEFPRSSYMKELDRKVEVSKVFLEKSDPNLLNEAEDAVSTPEQ